jgi:hypothetical protein
VKFYVYEHWRPDTDQCFYVGKGHGQRAYCLKRKHNIHHSNIVKMLSKLGMHVEIRLVAIGLMEEEAFKTECEKILFWRSVGVPLVNKTDGGEGTAGYKHTEDFKEKARVWLKKANEKRPISEKTREKMRTSHTGKKHTEEEKIKIGNSSRGRVLGPCSPEKRAKISLSKMGSKASLETRMKMSKARLGKKMPPRGPERRAKLSAALKGKPWSANRRAAQLAKNEEKLSWAS